MARMAGIIEVYKDCCFLNLPFGPSHSPIGIPRQRVADPPRSIRKPGNADIYALGVSPQTASAATSIPQPEILVHAKPRDWMSDDTPIRQLNMISKNSASILVIPIATEATFRSKFAMVTSARIHAAVNLGAHVAPLRQSSNTGHVSPPSTRTHLHHRLNTASWNRQNTRARRSARDRRPLRQELHSRRSLPPAGSKAIRAISAVRPDRARPRTAHCWLPTTVAVRSTASSYSK